VVVSVKVFLFIYTVYLLCVGAGFWLFNLCACCVSAQASGYLICVPAVCRRRLLVIYSVCLLCVGADGQPRSRGGECHGVCSYLYFVPAVCLGRWAAMHPCGSECANVFLCVCVCVCCKPAVCKLAMGSHAGVGTSE